MTVHPNSLANLRPGREQKYAEAKKRRHLTLTDTGWIAVKELAQQKFGMSVSEFLEQVGRGNFKILSRDEEDSSTTLT